MAKYYFNPDTLQYQKCELSKKRRWINFITFSVLLTTFSLLIFWLGENIITSPKMTRILAEREKYKYEIELINREVQQKLEDIDQIAYYDDHLYRVFFEVDPIPSTKREAGVGGVQRYRNLQNKPYSSLLVESSMNLDDMERKLVIQSKSFDEVIDLAITKEQRLAARPAIQPISIQELTRFGSKFGMRMHPIRHRWLHHDGIDLTAPRGTKIYATADGVVIQSAHTTGGYGKKIMIDHGFGYKTLYGHCSKLLVEKGQKVKRGEVIGLVGNTGLSTTNHLHYEVWINNRPVNPINYYANDLSADEYDKMINLLSKADPSFDIN